MGSHLRTTPTTAVDQAEARPTAFSSSPVSTCELLRSFTARAAADTAAEGPITSVIRHFSVEREGRKLKRHSLVQERAENHRKPISQGSDDDADDDDEFVDATPTHLDVPTPMTTAPEPSGASLLSPILGSLHFNTPYGWHEPPISPSPKHPPSRLFEIADWEAACSTHSQDPLASTARSTSLMTARPRFSSVSKSDDRDAAIEIEDRSKAGVVGPDSSPAPALMSVENSVKLRLRAQLAARRAAYEASSGSSVKSVHVHTFSTESNGSAAAVEGASKTGPGLPSSVAPVEEQVVPGSELTAAPSPGQLSIAESEEVRPSNEEVLAKMRAANAAAGRHSGSTPTTPTREASAHRQGFAATGTRSATGLSPIYTGPASVKSDSVKRESTTVAAQWLARSTASPARSVASSRTELLPKAEPCRSSTNSGITSKRDQKVPRESARLLGDGPTLRDKIPPSFSRSAPVHAGEKKERARHAASMTESQRIRQECQSSQASSSERIVKSSSELLSGEAADHVSERLSLDEVPPESTDPACNTLAIIPTLSPLSTSWSRSLFSATGRPAPAGVTADSPRASQAQSRSPSTAKRSVSPKLAVRMSRFEAMSTPPPASPVQGPNSSKNLGKTFEASSRPTLIDPSGATVAKDSPGLRCQDTLNTLLSQSQLPLEHTRTPSKVDPASLSSQNSPAMSAYGCTPTSQVRPAKHVSASPGSVESTPSTDVKKRSCAYQMTPFLGKDGVFGGFRDPLKDELVAAPGRGQRRQHEVQPLLTRVGDFVAADRAIRNRSSSVRPVLSIGIMSHNVTTPDRKQDAAGSPKVTWASPTESPFDRTPLRSDPLAPNPVNALLENDRKTVENAKKWVKETAASTFAEDPTPPRPTRGKNSSGGAVKADEATHAQRWGSSPSSGMALPQIDERKGAVEPHARSMATQIAPGEADRTTADLTQAVKQLSGAVAREAEYDYGAVSAAVFEILQMIREAKNREIRVAHKQQLERQVNVGLTAKERHKIECKRAEMARVEADRAKTADEFKSECIPLIASDGWVEVHECFAFLAGVRHAIDTLAANEAKTQNLLTEMVKHIHSAKSTMMDPASMKEVQKLLGSVKAGVDEHIEEVKGELSQVVQRILKEVEELRDERSNLQSEIANLMVFNVEQSLGNDPSTTSRGPRPMVLTSTRPLVKPISMDIKVRAKLFSPSRRGFNALIFLVPAQQVSAEDTPPSPPPSPQRRTAAGLGFVLFGPRMPRK
ncbi:BQ2448_6143 [Microbotryum intermedium]|uniref:BQ2448_6143 protein n=1 Tax=Microbotryum intermedium TaxID=269621 RepID=A0A238FNY3_9BASI|nr:BQ2448_6143 [Microbotryum intermedium]